MDTSLIYYSVPYMVCVLQESSTVHSVRKGGRREGGREGERETDVIVVRGELWSLSEEQSDHQEHR